MTDQIELEVLEQYFKTNPSSISRIEYRKKGGKVLGYRVYLSIPTGEIMREITFNDTTRFVNLVRTLYEKTHNSRTKTTLDFLEGKVTHH